MSSRERLIWSDSQGWQDFGDKRYMKGILLLLSGLIAVATAASAQTSSRNRPTVTLGVTQRTATEGEGSAILVVRRSGGTENPLRVFYGVGGNARNSLDYEKLTLSVVIPAGSNEATIEIIPLDDDIHEATERVVLRLRPAPGNNPKYRIGGARSRAIEILDNDLSAPNRLPPLSLGLRNPDYIAPGAVTILIRDGSPYTIETVELFANEQSLAVFDNPRPGRRFVNPRNSLDTARFKFKWSNVPLGAQTITARGTTTDGHTVFADPITFIVRP